MHARLVAVTISLLTAVCVAAPPEKTAPLPTNAPSTGSATNAGNPAARPAKPAKVPNAARGAVVSATSTNTAFPSELPPSALADGDLTTRWSSAYSEPQTIEMKLSRQPIVIRRIRVHWESAAASRYALSVSPDGRNWKNIYAYLNTASKAEPRVDEIPLNDIPASFIRLELISRANPAWGFSLYEIQVIAAE